MKQLIPQNLDEVLKVALNKGHVIIAENGENKIYAVAVPQHKVVTDENELYELAARADEARARQAILSRAIKGIKGVAVASAACAALTWAALTSSDVIAAWMRGVPMEIKEYRFITETVVPGATAELEVESRRSRFCIWNGVRSWRNVDTGVITRAVAGLTNPVDYAFHRTIKQVQVPKELAPGYYEMVSHWEAMCSHGDTYTIETPTTHISVLPSSPAS